MRNQTFEVSMMYAVQEAHTCVESWVEVGVMNVGGYGVIFQWKQCLSCMFESTWKGW